MSKSLFLKILFCAICIFFITHTNNYSAEVDVTCYRYSPKDQGVNTNEAILKWSTVNTNHFGLLASVRVSGQIYAAPLIIHHEKQNICIVCTMSNQIRGVDVSNPYHPKTAWNLDLKVAGNPVPSDDTGSDDIRPLIGTCSTPVIDAQKNMYIVSKSKTARTPPSYCYTIYKINTKNGRLITYNKFAQTRWEHGGYVFRKNIDPYVLGVGDGSIDVRIRKRINNQRVWTNENRVYFNALRQMNRPGLTLLRDTIYAAFASHGDNGPYHGWVIGFKADDLSLQAVFNTTPNGGLGGCWQSGGSIANDGENLFIETGNGSFSGMLDGQGFPLDANYGDCFLKLTPDGSFANNPNPNGWGLAVSDYFTPKNNGDINSADLDLGSCGPIVVDGFLIGLGKDGSLFSMDINHMGKYDPNLDNCWQSIPQAICVQESNDLWTAFGSPSYFDGKIYFFGSGDYGKCFACSGGQISGWFLDPVNQQVQTDVMTKSLQGTFDWPGANTTISSNGNQDGIVWAIHRSANTLRAFRVSDLEEIWNSGLIPKDNLGKAIKFSVPIVANGCVYAGTDGALKIYGIKKP